MDNFKILLGLFLLVSVNCRFGVVYAYSILNPTNAHLKCFAQSNYTNVNFLTISTTSGIDVGAAHTLLKIKNAALEA